ncbi:30S ribosomal protein S19e [Candidatus Woesearchaeota archaeon]|nr:MAG: 30S ribosomal protein S19e [Candidatus Woesearchaeota archaeon]
MVNIYEVPVNDFIERLAEELKKLEQIKAPDWSIFVKTGRHKERPPAREDWWHVRCAAVLRSVYKLGPIGVSKLRRKYGGKKNRGHKPEHSYPGSGSIARKALQQLEAAGLVKQHEKGVHKGRVITPKGVSLLEKTASKMLGGVPKKNASKLKASEKLAEKELQAKEDAKTKKEDSPAEKKAENAKK